ncbi:MAG TPA: glutaminase [Symbiobacteriaceae bacterium]|nr:glutaminase [Symbiobacteriaceae bacterium]
MAETLKQAIALGRAAVAAFGPALDARGNSSAGLVMLQHLSERHGLSQYDSYALSAPVCETPT